MMRENLSVAPNVGESIWTVLEIYNCRALQACICRPLNGDAASPPESDAVLLDVFRNELQPLFPFVIIDPRETAASLAAARSFLLAAIRMVASFRSLRSMRVQMYRLMAHLAEHMLVRSERSLELLQSIVVILGWYHYHCVLHAQMTNLLFLATSLIADLGLNQPPQVREQARLLVARPAEPVERTNDERRALLGVWFMSSHGDESRED